MGLVSCLTSLDARRKSLEGQERVLQQTIADMLERRHSNPQCNEIPTGAHMEDSMVSAEELRVRDRTLRKQVQEVTEELRELRSGCFFCLEEESGFFGPDDWGNVCDLIAPIEDDGSEKNKRQFSKYDTALGIVLGESLGVRVCSSLKTAMRIASGRAMTVWPLDHMARIQTYRVKPFRQFVSALKELPGSATEDRVVDPVSLLQTIVKEPPPKEKTIKSKIDDGSSSTDVSRLALFKACGTWLIVDNDDTAAAVIRMIQDASFGDTHQGAVCGAVTVGGNVHRVGSLQIQRSGNNMDIIHKSTLSCKAAQLRRYHEMGAKELALLEAVAENAGALQVAIASATRAKEEQELQAELNEARRRLDEVQRELSVVLRGPNYGTDLEAGEDCSVEVGLLSLQREREILERHLEDKKTALASLRHLLQAIDIDHFSSPPSPSCDDLFEPPHLSAQAMYHEKEAQKAAARLAEVQEEAGGLHAEEQQLRQSCDELRVQIEVRIRC